MLSHEISTPLAPGHHLPLWGPQLCNHHSRSKTEPRDCSSLSWLGYSPAAEPGPGVGSWGAEKLPRRLPPGRWALMPTTVPLTTWHGRLISCSLPLVLSASVPRQDCPGSPWVTEYTGRLPGLGRVRISSGKRAVSRMALVSGPRHPSPTPFVHCRLLERAPPGGFVVSPDHWSLGLSSHSSCLGSASHSSCSQSGHSEDCSCSCPMPGIHGSFPWDPYSCHPGKIPWSRAEHDMPWELDGSLFHYPPAGVGGGCLWGLCRKQHWHQSAVSEVTTKQPRTLSMNSVSWCWDSEAQVTAIHLLQRCAALPSSCDRVGTPQSFPYVSQDSHWEWRGKRFWHPLTVGTGMNAPLALP